MNNNNNNNNSNNLLKVKSPDVFSSLSSLSITSLNKIK